MNSHSIKDMLKGWFIGPFEPSVFLTDEVEVAFKQYEHGEHEPEHYQLTSVEITLITKGACSIGGVDYRAGDILTIPPMESADFRAITDVELVAVKIPARPKDKIVGRSSDFKFQMIIPMAGRGSRFTDAGFTLPKPLIPIVDRPMIQHVIDNLRTTYPQSWTFVVQGEHCREYGLDKVILEVVPDAEIVQISEVTRGAAVTALEGSKNLNPELPLIIANCDQYIDQSLADFFHSVLEKDGTILTMPGDDPKWSYVRFDDLGFVNHVVEKSVISTTATVGIYGFRRTSDFIWGAKSMILNDIATNGEYYVAPVYNELIKRGYTVGNFDVGLNMHGLGTPEDLEYFINQRII